MFFTVIVVVADLKRICETENGSLEIADHQARQMLKRNGLSTQCVQSKHTISCKDMSLAQLCLKINAKMGGANNSIANNKVGFSPLPNFLFVKYLQILVLFFS